MNPSPTTRLASVLDFADEELTANRAGRLSERQRVKQVRMRSKGRAFLALIALLVVAFVVFIAVVVPKLSKQNSAGSPPVTPIVAGVIAFVVLVMALSILRTRRRLDRLTSGQVAQTTGAAKTRVRQMRDNVDDAAGFEYGGGVNYELTIGSVRFFVAGKAVLDAFEDGRHYRGYCVGKSIMSTLLSAEPLD